MLKCGCGKRAVARNVFDGSKFFTDVSRCNFCQHVRYTRSHSFECFGINKEIWWLVLDFLFDEETNHDGSVIFPMIALNRIQKNSC